MGLLSVPKETVKRQNATLITTSILLFQSFVAIGQTPLLKQLAKEDKDFRTGKKVLRTDEDRIEIVLRLIAKGALKGPEDKFDAAIVLQHTPFETCGTKMISKSSDNYLLAHYLFISAYEGGYKDALYLIAASTDRYLGITKGVQKYGTERDINQATGKEEWVPIDRTTTDVERKRYGIPPLSKLLTEYPERALQ